MHVELRVEARNHLVEAAAFYDAQRDGLADYFIDCLFSDLEMLESEAGIDELAFGLHRKLTERFPLAIYYRVADPVIDVVAIFDCRRDPYAIARRLGRNRAMNRRSPLSRLQVDSTLGDPGSWPTFVGWNVYACI